MVSRGRARVPRVRLAAGQGLLVLPAGRLLPVDQRLPEQRVEPPHAARGRGRPRLKPNPVRAGVEDRGGHLGRDVGLRLRATAQVDGELVGLGGGSGDRPGPAVSSAARTGRTIAVSRKLALYWIQSQTTRTVAQVGVRPAQRLDHRPHRRLRAGRAAQPRRRPDVDLHRQPADKDDARKLHSGRINREAADKFSRQSPDMFTSTPVFRPLYSHAKIVGAHSALWALPGFSHALMLPQRVRGYIRRPHKLGRRGLVRLHKRQPLPPAVMAAHTRRSKAGQTGHFGVKTGGAPLR